MPDTKPPIDALTKALGRVTSGIYILTLGADAGATGMLASWVQQAGFDPPMLTVAVKRGRHVAERLAEGEPFVLSVVGEGQTGPLKHFGKGFEPGEPAFEGVETIPSKNGVPMLADAIATLECSAEGSLDTPDHTVFLARVTSGGLRDESSPMVHIRKRGDHY